MKGLFNKALVIALLVSVCGVRAEVTDMSGKQLFVAAATQLSKEAKEVAVAGLNTVKNCPAVSSAAEVLRNAGSAIVNGASTVSAKIAPVLARQTKALKLAASAVKNSAAKAIEASKPSLTAVLGYAMHAKDGVKSFYAHHTVGCQVAALVTAYVGLCVYADYLNFQARIKSGQACECCCDECTQVDVDELNNDIIG